MPLAKGNKNPHKRHQTSILYTTDNVSTWHTATGNILQYHVKMSCK